MNFVSVPKCSSPLSVFSAVTSSCMCVSSVVPQSGVIPSDWTKWYTARGVEQSFAFAMAAMAGCESKLGEPVNVQNDLQQPFIAL